MFKIELITDKIGNEKIHERYPLRKGSIFSNIHMYGIGSVCYLEYLKDSAGESKDGYLTTSRVEQVTVDGLNYMIPDLHINITKGRNVIIHTMNSVYHISIAEGHEQL